MKETAKDLEVDTFQQFLNERKLVGVSCLNCLWVYVPPRQICLKCNQSDMKWFRMSGRGKLAGFTSVYVVPSTMLNQGYGRHNPYLTGIVKLEEGPQIPALLFDMDPKKPHKIKIGMDMEAVFFEHTKHKKIALAFRPSQIGHSHTVEK